MFKKTLNLILLTILLLTTAFSYGISAQAAVTTPAPFIYEGKLLDAVNSPITTAHTFRFSLWSSDDLVAGDITGGGAINLAAPAYGGWNEVQTVTPNTDGTFFFELGSVTPLPNMNIATHTDLQVEIKTFGAPDTSYEVMDPTGDNGVDTDDRQTVGSSPFTNNADFLDNAEIGTTAGDIVTLGAGNVFSTSVIPGGNDVDTFIIDDDDSVGAGGSIGLQFGNALAQILSFVVTSDWFNFNNDVNIQGNLTLTGTVDGVDISALAFSDVATRVKDEVFTPEYPYYTVEPDGTTNKGKLFTDFVDAGGANKINFYEWNTKQGAIQDIDIVISYQLPLDFVSFTGTPLSLNYNTSDGVIGTNKIDVAMYDTTGAAVVLTGGTNLANAAWTTANITFGGGETFAAGDTVTLHLKLSSTNTGFARVSDVVLNYNGR